MKNKNRRLFALIVLIYLIVEGTCYFNLRVLGAFFNISYQPNMSSLSEKQKTLLQNFLNAGRGQHVEQDSVLGWVYRDSTNSAGMRNSQEYAKVPLPGKLRLSAFGDSFTFGSDVALDSTWAKQLTRINPELEVLNYGVGAYGLDQAYLRYDQIGANYHPQIVLIGYMSENLARHVNVYRGFYTHMYPNTIFTKPRFKIQDEELVLLENPLSSYKDYEYFLSHGEEVLANLGKNDYHYQMNYNRGKFDFLPSVRFAKVFIATIDKRLSDRVFTRTGMYNVNSEAYKITEKIFSAFYHDILANGVLPVIVVFPDINDQWRSRQKKETRYTPLLDHFNTRGFRYIDLLEALKPYETRYTVDDLVENWGHYSPLGNKIIAEFISSRLHDWGFTNQSNVREAVRMERESRLKTFTMGVD